MNEVESNGIGGERGMIRAGRAGAGLLAHIIVSKFDRAGINKWNPLESCPLLGTRPDAVEEAGGFRPLIALRFRPGGQGQSLS
jgi:hypothetical protein